MMCRRFGWILIYAIMGAIVLPGSADVVINEIMYDPSTAQGDDSFFEYIELVNPGSARVDVSGWSFTSGTFFTFPSGTSLEAGQYLAVCANQDSARAFYGITNTVGNFSNRLNNAGEIIRLVNAGGVIQDEVAYLASAPWPTQPAGTGPSLELIHYDLINSIPTNWAASSDFGTPGAINSVFAPEDTTSYYSLYFNQIVHTSYHTSAIAQGLIPIADELIARINDATATLDVCAYSLTDATVATAMINAHSRGVQVRFITEHDNLSSQTAALQSAGIPVIDDAFGINSGSGLMHDKFAVIDYQGSGDGANIVWTGSYNLTANGSTVNANNGIAIQDEGLAGAYTAEFNEMWGSAGIVPNESASRFGWRKTDNITHNFTIDGHQIGVYMSPSDGVDTAIENAIATADHEIAFCILAFTRADIMLAMKAKWDDNVQYPDFQVEGVFDAQNAASQYSQWWNMSGQSGAYVWSPAADVWVDSLQPAGALLHHKYMVIDGNHPGSDPIVITGSTNWSNNGIDDNDENLVIIHDAEVANLYMQEFYARKSQAMGNLPPIYDVQWPQSTGMSSPYGGQQVTITGVVSAAFPDATHRKYMIQGPYSASWWGIYVYQIGTGSNFTVGDSVSVTGLVQEYYDLTEIGNPSFSSDGMAIIVPEPMHVTTLDAATQESLESVLVQVGNVSVLSAANGDGEWQVDDGSGACWVDDLGSYSYIPHPGDTIVLLTGVVYYSSGEFKLEPRDDDDFDLSHPRVENLTIQRMGNHIVLQWETLPGALSYRIHADSSPNFDPSSGNQVGMTANTQWLDANALSGNAPARFYKIVAEY
jgi:phosphatidylserine/phosphatidylglycerophosphate/cardiolipin synthase-like enzyme